MGWLAEQLACYNFPSSLSPEAACLPWSDDI